MYIRIGRFIDLRFSLFRSILRFYESGIQGKLQKIVTDSSVPVIEDDSFTPIIVEQMVQVLSIPFVGVLLAVTVVFCEYLYLHHRTFWMKMSGNDFEMFIPT